VAPGRVLGIDAGERRVGLALSDELQLLARPLLVLDRRGGTRAVLDRIREIAAREGVERIVVGWPLNADGSVGRQAKRAEAFAALTTKAVGLPVQLWDERLSTLEAEAVLRASGGRRGARRRRGEVDAVAAAVILQQFLDARRPEAGP
jgi:putative holliday junction resolvase